MYSYDMQMSEIHVLLGWCSLLLFGVRGLAYQLGAAWATDSRLGILSFGINFLLVITGLSLWVLFYLNPMRDGWLMAKLLALCAFAACSHWAFGQGEFRALGYGAGVAMLSYVIGVSLARSPWLGLV
jgi:uncharacterized membrane protein SirB2